VAALSKADMVLDHPNTGFVGPSPAFYCIVLSCVGRGSHKNKNINLSVSELVMIGGFEAFTAVMFQVDVFWVVKPCSVVVGYQRFGGPC
jgi:hypothetical protein